MIKWIVGLAITVLILSIALTAVVSPNLFGSTPKKVDGPAVKEAKALIAEQEDRREAESLLHSEFARRVPCGAVVDQAYVVAGPTAKSARVWVLMREDGIIECFDAKIAHPSERVDLKSISKLEIDIIKANPELYPPPRRQAPQPAPAAAPAPAATPAPVVVVVPSPAPCVHSSGVRILSEGGRCSNH